jgi:hypothetical protein
MSDPVPHNRHPVGRLISLLFHPLVIFIPTLVIVLKDANPLEAVGWVALIAAVIFTLAAVMLARLRRQGRETYQRDARHQIYLSFWVSMVLCTALGVALNAPHRLIFSQLCLVVWVPIQSLVNARYTKISIHVAVVTGIAAALVAMGDLNTLPLIGAAVVVIAAVAWARLVTGNHTRLQIALGILVSVVSVVIAYGLMSLWRPL